VWIIPLKPKDEDSMAEAKKTTKRTTKKSATTETNNGGDGIHPIAEATPSQSPASSEQNGETSGAMPLATATGGEAHNVGLSSETEQGVVKILNTLLADEFVFYTKLRKYHWNVVGREFLALHEAFEKQYEEVAEYIDTVAERIRAYGVIAPGTLQEFQQLARLQEQPGVNPDARQMVMDVMQDHESLVRSLRADIETIDDEFDDDGAEDLLTGLLQAHQKHAWMMRALLQG
jgi:starvation-inducible DNA-binding protein